MQTVPNVLVTMPKIADPVKLKAAREAKGWTMVDVELETYRRGFKVARNTIANLEHGRSAGTIEVLGRLAEAYGKKAVDDLMSEESEVRKQREKDAPRGSSPRKRAGRAGSPPGSRP